MKKRILHYIVVAVHKFHVARGLFDLALGLMWRALTHDLSKFRNTEAREFAEHLPMLKTIQYGSPHYHAVLKKMKDALEAHYDSNRHHPEHWKYGLHEMDAVDLCEMLCDWAAAARSGPSGDLLKSVDHNQERFHTGSIMADVFRNTALFRWGPESLWKRRTVRLVLWALTIGTTAHFLFNWIVDSWPLPTWLWVTLASATPVAAVVFVFFRIRRII